MALLSIPGVADESPLLERGGWSMLEGAITPEDCEALLDEARALYGEGERTDSTEPDPEQQRGGNPARGFTSVVGGPRQGALYHSAELAVRLVNEVGGPIRPSAELGTYSFFEEPGDHLSVHRDLEGCDVTVATCLQDTGEPGFECGAVCMWPRHVQAPLSDVRIAPDLDTVMVRLGVGESLLFFGSYIPHAILPVASGQDLLLSLLCFRLGVPE